jgi:hypothetical protein
MRLHEVKEKHVYSVWNTHEVIIVVQVLGQSTQTAFEGYL